MTECLCFSKNVIKATRVVWKVFVQVRLPRNFTGKESVFFMKAQSFVYRSHESVVSLHLIEILFGIMCSHVH